MRALHLKTQWVRSNAAAAIDAATEATFNRGLSRQECADPRQRRRANVFLGAPVMTSGLIRRFRLILPHILLLCTTIFYAILGAVCFSYMEKGYETGHMTRYVSNAVAAQNALFDLQMRWSNATERNGTQREIEAAIDRIMQTAMEAYAEGIRPKEISYNAVPTQHKVKWSFQASLYFSVTVLTSVGYGNFVPISRLGRIFCIVYGTFGIPLTLITIADVAKFLSDVIAKLEAKYKRRHKTDSQMPEKRKEASETDEGDDENDLLAEPGSWSKTFVLVLLLSYMALSALGCSIFTETWNFLDSFYFCLITMTTIGFGDLDPALDYTPPEHYAGWICFIFLGLILSTLTVDMCGSAAIHKMHAWGRGIDALAIFSALTKGGNQNQWLAFQPDEFSEIPYIDQKIRLSQAEKFYGLTYENSIGKVSDSTETSQRS